MPGSTKDYPDRCWFADGIVYAVYESPLTLESVGTMMDECDKLILKSGREVAPLVCVFAERTTTETLGAHHIGRITNHDLVKHTSIIVLVGAERLMPGLLATTIRLFLNNRVQLCKSMDEATAEAKKHVSTNTAILEQLDPNDEKRHRQY